MFSYFKKKKKEQMCIFGESNQRINLYYILQKHKSTSKSFAIVSQKFILTLTPSFIEVRSIAILS